MVAYSFQRQFVPKILFGTKTQTIRRLRASSSRHARPGEMMSLYIGMRTKHCSLIGTATCERLSVATIDFHKRIIDLEHSDGTTERIWRAGLDRFAVADGFENWAEMLGFWSRYHFGVAIFEGIIIHWKDLVPCPT